MGGMSCRRRRWGASSAARGGGGHVQPDRVGGPSRVWPVGVPSKKREQQPPLPRPFEATLRAPDPGWSTGYLAGRRRKASAPQPPWRWASVSGIYSVHSVGECGALIVTKGTGEYHWKNGETGAVKNGGIPSHSRPFSFVPFSSTSSRHNPPQPTSRVLCLIPPPISPFSRLQNPGSVGRSGRVVGWSIQPSGSSPPPKGPKSYRD